MRSRAERAESSPLRIGDVFLGKYQVLEVVGSGGHGCVYGAQSLFMGREVAIKVLDGARGTTEEARARGQREAIALGRLGRHPGIVEVYDAGIDLDGRLYIVMERLEGCTLHQHLRQHGPFDVASGLRLLIALCEALEFARQAKVVHRDIKPTNIFITPEGKPKLVDFGVAKITDAPGFQTAPKVVVGTALYVSPEQIRAQPATHRSDLYALGLVAYQIFSREHPLLLAAPDADRRDLRVIWALHLNADPPRLDQVIPGFPEYVARLVHTAMSREPAKRYASAAEFGRRAQQTLTRYEQDCARDARQTVEPARTVVAEAEPVVSMRPERPFTAAASSEPKAGTPTPVHTVSVTTFQRALATPSTEQFLPPTPPDSSGDPPSDPESTPERELPSSPAEAQIQPGDLPVLLEASVWTTPSASPPVAPVRQRSFGPSAWSVPVILLGLGMLVSLSLLNLAWPSPNASPVTSVRREDRVMPAPRRNESVKPREVGVAFAAEPALVAAAQDAPVAAVPEPPAPRSVSATPTRQPVARGVRKRALRVAAGSPSPPAAPPHDEPSHWADSIAPPEAASSQPPREDAPQGDQRPELWLN